MADVTIYRDPAQVNIVVKDGVPPVDQSAQVTQLTADLATANGTIGTLRAAIQAELVRAQARKDADAAKVDGQDTLDALTGL